MLRSFGKLALVFCVVTIVAPPTSTAADKDAMSLVNKGIAFMGGAKNLKKYKAATWKEKGVFYGMGEGLPYTAKNALQWPGKFRMEIVGIFTQIYDGKQGWVQAGGQTTAMTKDQLAAMSEQNYAGFVTSLIPLREKTYKLSLDGQEKVNGADAAIVKVESKGRHVVRLFLDSKTGRLVKSEHSGAMEGMPKNIVKFVSFYEEYKSAGKIKFCSKARMTRAGKKFVEATITDFKPAVSLDAKIFAKPK